jgi:membrane protease YdiL (CAAX protease family)
LTLKEIIEEFAGQVNIVDLIVCAAGLLVLTAWLLRTGLGRKALDYAPIRRNDMLPHIAFIPFLFWFLTVYLLALVKEKALPDISGWQDAFAGNLILCLSAAPSIVITLVIAKRHLARGIKGLGFEPKTIVKDFGAALLNMLAIMPVIVVVLVLTILAGKLIAGPQFVMPRHQELNEIMKYPQWQVQAIIIITAICVVPFTEEMLFRGVFSRLWSLPCFTRTPRTGPPCLYSAWSWATPTKKAALFSAQYSCTRFSTPLASFPPLGSNRLKTLDLPEFTGKMSGQTPKSNMGNKAIKRVDN